MERGPAALFWAIVAVGLGPAMWLGARMGAVEIAPDRPPAVVGEHTSGPDHLVGGAGAADNPVGDNTTLRSQPAAKVVPLAVSPSPTPSATSPSPTPSVTSASPTATGGPSPSDKPTTPPTNETSGPTTPPTDETSDPADPPSPPTDHDPVADPPKGPGNPNDTGGIGAGTAS